MNNIFKVLSYAKSYETFKAIEKIKTFTKLTFKTESSTKVLFYNLKRLQKANLIVKKGETRNTHTYEYTPYGKKVLQLIKKLK